ncbi:transporter substrate-binding domain-containing protein [bacterium]|nr:MAG: transporter substrate-binding domain-containing protein [bacterium]
MKNYTTLLISIVVCMLHVASVKSQSLRGDSYLKAKSDKEAKIVVTYLEEDVFAYTNSNGELDGIVVEIFHHFQNWIKNAKGIHLEIEYIPEANFKKFYTSVKDANVGVFGIGTTTILPQRQTEVKFSEPYISNIAVLITQGSVPTLIEMSDAVQIFSHMTGVTGAGMTLEKYLLGFQSKNGFSTPLHYVNSQAEIIHEVLTVPNRYAYVDLTSFWPLMDKYGDSIKRHPVADLSTESFGFIMPLNSDWDEPLNEFFNIGAGYRSSVLYRKVLQKYLGPEVVQMLKIAVQKPAIAEQKAAKGKNK